ncbi:Protein RCC2 [Portunus trituberculatus]|uniref:Protein RCC2 n=1 Tax=Portunus trituberculatus TaxID=210409 RepID=A0A5B7KG82_PORTR|nr:Protein RCC2 [Portunus trituberculatus]
MIVDKKGYLYSFGLPEYGQLGHNTDGKFFVTSNKLSFQYERVPRRVPIFVERSKDGHPTPVTDVQIVDIACGNNHTGRGPAKGKKEKVRKRSTLALALQRVQKVPKLSARIRRANASIPPS